MQIMFIKHVLLSLSFGKPASAKKTAVVGKSGESVGAWPPPPTRAAG